MISIIIPVYNRINKLSASVKSVLKQTYKDIEIILVDDGSTDGSSELCDKLAFEDDRIKVIHQNNQGVAVARNTGILKASGDYIGFVDSDDLIEPQMYETMYKNLVENSVDLVVCGSKIGQYNKNTKLISNNINYHFDQLIIGRENILTEILKLLTGSLMNPVWNKLYKVENIKKYNIKFPKNIPLGEDLLFNLQYYKTIESIKFLSECLYIYIIDEKDGTLARYYENKFVYMNSQYKGVIDYVSNVEEDSPQHQKQIDFLYIKWIYSCFIDLFCDNCLLNKKDKYIYIKNILREENVNEVAKSNISTRGINGLLSRTIYKKNINMIYIYSHLIYLLRFKSNGLYYIFLKLITK